MSMDKIFNFLESNEECQFTIKELQEVLTKDDYMLDKKTILQRLKLKYNDDIIIANDNKSHSIICFVKSQHHVLNDRWYASRIENQEDEELRILSTAAEILRKKIRSIPCDINPVSYTHLIILYERA